jgi:hypothetical protein
MIAAPPAQVAPRADSLSHTPVLSNDISVAVLMTKPLLHVSTKSLREKKPKREGKGVTNEQRKNYITARAHNFLHA